MQNSLERVNTVEEEFDDSGDEIMYEETIMPRCFGYYWSSDWYCKFCCPRTYECEDEALFYDEWDWYE